MKKKKAQDLFKELATKNGLVYRPTGVKLMPKDDSRKPKSVKVDIEAAFAPFLTS
jgi:hypothetical protein